MSDHFAVAVLMGIIGGGNGALTPIAWGVMQEITPGYMVGRVFSLYTSGAMAAAIAGMTTFGWITQEFGDPTSIISIGLTLFATALTAVSLSRWVHVHQAVPASMDSIEETCTADAYRPDANAHTSLAA